jgi:hypothetical protein
VEVALVEHDFVPEVGDGVRFGEPAFEKAIAHSEKEGDFGLGCGLAHFCLLGFGFYLQSVFFENAPA